MISIPLWKAIVFTLGTGFLISISRASLNNPRSHGFFRFFAWETILALFLLNINHWFENPAAWNQVIAWVLLVVCVIPVVWGTILLRSLGRPVDKRIEDPNLLAFEKTTSLVTTGIYKYIRHPLYSSLLLLDWGIFFKLPSLIGGTLAMLATVFLILTARADESECTRYFGPVYQQYMKKTRRFIPFIF